MTFKSGETQQKRKFIHFNWIHRDHKYGHVISFPEFEYDLNHSTHLLACWKAINIKCLSLKGISSVLEIK